MSAPELSHQTLQEAIEFIDPWLTRRSEYVPEPGFVVAIAHMGNTAYKGAFGFADMENQRPMTPDDKFQIGSQTKTFTAAGIMQLAEAGDIDIDDPVTRYIRELEDHSDERWGSITIRCLLSHGSGISRDGQDADFWEHRRPFPTGQSLLDEIKASGPVIDPNTQMKYSNLGYGILGQVIEKASGTPYRDYVEQSILQPLDLTDTHTDITEPIDGLVAGYGRLRPGGARERLRFVSADALIPATGFYSTVGDLCKFYHANIPDNGNTAILSEESKREMHRTHWPVKNSPGVEYGLGVDIGYAGKRRLTGHGGGYPGHLTHTFVDAQNNLVVTAFTNCIDGSALNISLGTVKTIDHFQSRAVQESNGIRRFNCRIGGLWAVRQVVGTGNSLVSINPDTWNPFGEDTEELAVVDDQTLRVVNTNGFKSEGELVRYTFNGSGVDSVNYCGRTMVPE